MASKLAARLTAVALSAPASAVAISTAVMAGERPSSPKVRPGEWNIETSRANWLFDSSAASRRCASRSIGPF